MQGEIAEGAFLGIRDCNNTYHPTQASLILPSFMTTLTAAGRETDFSNNNELLQATSDIIQSS